jgi:hypothetical protein
MRADVLCSLLPTAAVNGRVSIFVSACQYYELFFDGARVGDHELDVVWTRFDRNRSYGAYSVRSVAV